MSAASIHECCRLVNQTFAAMRVMQLLVRATQVDVVLRGRLTLYYLRLSELSCFNL